MKPLQSVLLLLVLLAHLCIGEELQETCEFEYIGANVSFLSACTLSSCNSSCKYDTFRTCICYTENEDLVRGDGILYALLALSYTLTTVVFPVLIFFNVDLASGPRQSFVFFYQCLPLVTPWGKWLVYLVVQNQVYDAEYVQHPLASRFYTLEYFKYVIVVAEVLVVLFLVKCTWCPHQKCRLPWAKVRRAVRNFREEKIPKHTILHGICSGLLLAYGDLVAISSLMIVNFYRTCCYDTDGGCPEYCVYTSAIQELYGYTDVAARFTFSGIPLIVYILLLPLPLSLIYYPSIPALFHKLTGRSLPRFPKLDPVFDVFQGVYKDKMRWFAGVHLFHRMILWAMHAALYLDPNLQNFISLTLLVIILGMHSLFQPYKLTKHNYMESLSLIYLTLIGAINQLALFIRRVYSEGAAETASRTFLDPVADVIPNLFSYLTLVMGLLPVVGLLLLKLYKHCRKNKVCRACLPCVSCVNCCSKPVEEANPKSEELTYHAEW